jgi:hypothetical protein
MSEIKSQPLLVRMRDFDKFQGLLMEPIEKTQTSTAFGDDDEREDPYEQINCRKPYEKQCFNNYSSSELMNAEHSEYKEIRKSTDKADYVYLKINN